MSDITLITEITGDGMKLTHNGVLVGTITYDASPRYMRKSRRRWHAEHITSHKERCCRSLKGAEYWILAMEYEYPSADAVLVQTIAPVQENVHA